MIKNAIESFSANWLSILGIICSFFFQKGTFETKLEQLRTEMDYTSARIKGNETNLYLVITKAAILEERTRAFCENKQNEK